MKQLGNLALVCAKRKDTLLQILDGVATVHVGRGEDRTALSAPWEDDEAITVIIRELNFGRFSDRMFEMERSA